MPEKTRAQLRRNCRIGMLQALLIGLVLCLWALQTLAAEPVEAGGGNPRTPPAADEKPAVPDTVVKSVKAKPALKRPAKARAPGKNKATAARAAAYTEPRLAADSQAPLAPPPLAGARPHAGGHDGQLQAIRRALLEATLEQPTRVVSTAWVDDRGALHESAQFQSRAEIRGVRVLAYTEKDGEPRAQVSASVLPWGLKPGGKTAESCEQPPRNWRLPLQLEGRLAPGFGGDQRYAGEALLDIARQALKDESAQSRRWYPHASRPALSGQYLQALAGGPASLPSGWVARVELRPSASEEKSSLGRVGDWFAGTNASWRWTLALSVGQQGASAPAAMRWEMSAVIEVPRDQLANSPRGWLKGESARIGELLREWMARIDAQTECEPPQFVVRRNAPDELAVLAGQGSGLRAGDRVLLINRARLPSQILEVDASMSMALAEIRQVGAQQSTLAVLAGPPLPDQGDWVALPF